MLTLDTQEQLEELLGKIPPSDPSKPLPRATIVYFTANWCSACRKLDLAALQVAFPALLWLKCDVDANNYSAGYCGVRSIPSFMLILDKRPIGPFQSSVTEKVGAWIQLQLEANGLCLS